MRFYLKSFYKPPREYCRVVVGETEREGGSRELGEMRVVMIDERPGGGVQKHEDGDI